MCILYIYIYTIYIYTIYIYTIYIYYVLFIYYVEREKERNVSITLLRVMFFNLRMFATL